MSYHDISEEFLYPERGILVGVQLPHVTASETDEYMNELALLADTAGVEVVAQIVQSRSGPHQATYIGKGKVDEIAELGEEKEVLVVIFDDDLTPAQARNLENAFGCRVLDRSGLILDIFATRARTRESRVQVELAQLEYLRPRLTRLWTHLERQAAAGGGGAGGRAPVGMRGPGETQLETDRRLMGRKIAHLTSELKKIEQVRETQSKNRQDVFRIAIVGYTNAGKSTLLKSLTGADVLVEDRLFATLDATTRSLQLDSNKHVTITDTVGFIRKLPHNLVASFRSTLSEAKNADCILHVIDSSHPFADDHLAEGRNVLGELDIEPDETLLVMNKSDQIETDAIAKRLAEGDDYVMVSALTGRGMDDLKDRLRAFVEVQMVEVEMQIPQNEGKLISAIHEFGEVIDTRYVDNDVVMTARIHKNDAGRIQGLSRYAPALFS